MKWIRPGCCPQRTKDIGQICQKSIPEGRDALRARGACPQSTEGRQRRNTVLPGRRAGETGEGEALGMAPEI